MQRFERRLSKLENGPTGAGHWRDPASYSSDEFLALMGAPHADPCLVRRLRAEKEMANRERLPLVHPDPINWLLESIATSGRRIHSMTDDDTAA